MRISILTMAALAAAAAVPATAAPAGQADRNGYQAIVAGDYTGAARRLEAERRIYRDRPELMLNLAAVYAQMGRSNEARSLYVDVLRRPVVAMDVPSGAVVSSHDVATLGMQRLAGAGLIARR